MALLAFLTVLALVPTLAVDAQAQDKDSVCLLYTSDAADDIALV